LAKSLPESATEFKAMLPGLDKMILDKAMEWGRRCYQAMLEEMDKVLAEHRDSKLQVKHRRGVWYQTCLGAVKVRRRQYRGGGGERRCLLDECLGMDRYRHTTLRVKELALDMASMMPYRRSAEVIRKTTAIDITHQTIWRLVAKAADQYLDKAKREMELFMETGEMPKGDSRQVSRLMIEADGVMLSLQRDHQRKAEVKLGIAYEGWKKTGKDRYQTVNKTCFAAVGSGDSFWAGMTLKLNGKYDMAVVKDTVIGGDGAKWVKEGAGYMKGQFQLDRYHLNRELTTALGKDKDTKGRIWRACDRGKVDSGLRIMAEAIAQAKGEQAARLKMAYHYMWENRSGIADYRSYPDRQNGIRHTGVIEGNVDKLVVRRMKNQGMSWSLRGISRLLCVRFLVLEGKLMDWLKQSTIPVAEIPMPVKSIRRIVTNLSFHEPDDWLKATLPAFHGPHAGRPWVSVLKHLTEVNII
jgi:hypothetical protein